MGRPVSFETKDADTELFSGRLRLSLAKGLKPGTVEIHD